MNPKKTRGSLRQFIDNVGADYVTDCLFKIFSVDELTFIPPSSLTAGEKKATRDQVQKKFGEDGLVQLDRLLKLEIVSEKDGRTVDNLEGVNFPDEDTTKRIAMHSYVLTSLSTPGSLLENFRAAVTAEAIREIYEAGEEYREKIHRIIDTKKGDNLISGSLIAGPME